MNWTRITDPDSATTLFPPWLGSRMIGRDGTFGLLLATGDIMRITSIVAVHQSSSGMVLLDVRLDHAGVPEGVDMAWSTKHYLGVPVPTATLATVNLGHVVAVIEFVAAEIAEPARDLDIPGRDEIVEELERAGLTTDAVARVTE